MLLYTLPGIPSVYYGSEFGIEGKKEQFSDASLRPALHLQDYADAYEQKACTRLISALGRIHQNTPALSYGDFRELLLTNRQYAFARTMGDTCVVVMVNNDDVSSQLTVGIADGSYTGALSGKQVTVTGGQMQVMLDANSGEIWIPAHDGETIVENVETQEKANVDVQDFCDEETAVTADKNVDAQDMSVEELQAAILAKLAANGPVTEQMKRDVAVNVYRDSLLNWVKSFQ